jgi:hypothetical protein
LAATSGIHTWDAQVEDTLRRQSPRMQCDTAYPGATRKIPPLELRLSDTMDYQILASQYECPFARTRADQELRTQSKGL